jgi:hypothetical protein
MNLAGRIARLEKALGDPNVQKRVVISTASDRHESAWHGSDSLWLSIPFPGYPRPIPNVRRYGSPARIDGRIVCFSTWEQHRRVVRR